MRSLLTTMLLFSCLAFAQEGDPRLDVEVFILKIPPAGQVTSTAGTDLIMIKGLPHGAEIVGLPQGWEAESPPGGGMILLQGPAAEDEIIIRFTTPEPNWETRVEGFSGMESLWDAGLLTPESLGISTMTMNADDVASLPAAKCFRAKQRAKSYKTAHANNENIEGEPATTSDVLGTWISEPALGQLGIIQNSYSFQEDGTFSLKLDFISFCDGCNRGIDCDYFWIVYEGSFTGHDGVFTLNNEKDKKVILVPGQAEPEITENSEYPNSYAILIERKGEKLLIRKSAGDEATVLKREN